MLSCRGRRQLCPLACAGLLLLQLLLPRREFLREPLDQRRHDAGVASSGLAALAEQLCRRLLMAGDQNDENDQERGPNHDPGLDPLRQDAGGRVAAVADSSRRRTAAAPRARLAEAWA